MSEGFDGHGNQFRITDEPPYLTRWRGMRGSAVEKLAAFDQKLARQLKQRKITLPMAKMILLQRDVDATAKRQVARLVASEPPYMGIVVRLILPCGLNGCVMLKCTCGATREGLTYLHLERENTYRVVCPKCGTLYVFEGAASFAFKGKDDASVYRDLIEHQCDIPVRELEER
jgi:hypothetical protein